MKKIFSIIAALFFILILAALVAPYFISADTMKATVISKIEAATGRTLKVDGQFKLTFFPVAGVTMENVTLSNPPRFQDMQPLMTLKSLTIAVAVLPLLHKEIEIKELVLEDPSIHLHVNKDGLKNWLPPQTGSEPQSQPATTSSPSSMPLPSNLLLSDVKIKDGLVTYNDEAAKSQWEMKKLNVAVSLSTPSSPFNFDAGGEWKGKTIKIKATMATLQSFLNQERTNIEASIKGDGFSYDVKGTIAVGQQAGKPRIDLDLTTGVLDFNPFLPEQHADIGGLLFSDAFAETDGRWSDKPMDFSGLEAVNGTANIVADGIVVNKITLGKTTLRAKLENGKLNADKIDTVLYGGTGNIMLTVDAATSTFEKRASLKGIQVQPLFKDALDMSRLSGTADIDMNTTSRGKSMKELVAALAGNGQFTMKDGAIEGVDLTSLIANKSGGAQKTPISEMKGSFTIAQGIVSNRDLVMTLPTLHISGQGDINLPAYSINYRLTPQVVQAADETGAAKKGVAVPVIVEGSLEKPSFRPDLNALAQEALKNPQAFKEQLKNTRDNLKDQLKSPDGAKNLKNLLKGF